MTLASADAAFLATMKPRKTRRHAEGSDVADYDDESGDEDESTGNARMETVERSVHQQLSALVEWTKSRTRLAQAELDHGRLMAGLELEPLRARRASSRK